MKLRKDSVMLVTGGTGTIGSAIVRRLLTKNVKRVIVFSRDELKQYEMRSRYLYDEKLEFFLGDVRDKDSLTAALEGVDAVFHAAALKQVPICEAFPLEAIETNVVGTRNLLDAARTCEVGRVILISTDKAVHPTGTMGATKMLAEKLVQQASLKKHSTTSCVCRFGNVIFSRGSVIPSLSAQIQKRHECMVTDPDMTRFIMTIEEAVNLVIYAAENSQGGEVFIPRMRTVRLGDLISAMVKVIAPSLGIPPESVRFRIIGRRKGEKLHEELFTEEEGDYMSELPGALIVDPSRNRIAANSLRRKLARYRISNSSKAITIVEMERLLSSFNDTEREPS